MTKTGILLVGSLFAVSSVLALGCSDDTEGDTTSSSSSSSSASSSGESSSSSSSSSSSGGSTATAEKYCADMKANCTGANAQYPADESCMAAALSFPAGAASDTKGDTLGCRAYHSGAAKADAALHCVHAGPAGGGTAFCGETCEGFCDLAATTCPGEWPVKADCLTECKKFQTAVMNYNISITSGDTVECRLYHLSVAATDAASAATHCEHTKPVSTQCK